MKMLTKISFFVILNLTVWLLALPAYASYTITLKNGEQLQAEGYKIEGENISLRFRQGSAAFPKKLVKSIEGTDAPDTPMPPEPPTPQPEQAQQPQQSHGEPLGGPSGVYTLPLTADPQAGDNPDDTSYINEGDGPGEGGETR